MTIGKKLQEEADRLQKKRERASQKKARQRARKKANAGYEEITIRIYDPDAMKAIIAEGAGGQASGWQYMPKLGLAMAVEQWLSMICRIWRRGELHSLGEMADKHPGPDGLTKWARQIVQPAKGGLIKRQDWLKGKRRD